MDLPAIGLLPASDVLEVLFLLPGGRPRRLVVATFIAAIQAGGLPRLRPRPRASRSRLRIASSICSRSWRNSANIFDTSIIAPNCAHFRRPGCLVPDSEQNIVGANTLHLLFYFNYWGISRGLF